MSIERTPQDVAQFHADMDRIRKQRSVAEIKADNAAKQNKQPSEITRRYDLYPELLAALKALVGGEHNPPMGMPGHVDYADAVAMARAVIAKCEHK